jgi:hypothetical protein
MKLEYFSLSCLLLVVLFLALFILCTILILPVNINYRLCTTTCRRPIHPQSSRTLSLWFIISIGISELTWASLCYNPLMNNYNFTLNLNPDDMFLSIILRFVVPALLLSVGIALFSYMVSKGKRRQGVVALSVGVLVTIGWITLTVISQ